MRKFTDAEGREWTLFLNLWLEREIHKESGVYLSDLSDNATLARLQNDPSLMGDVLWGFLKEQCAEAKVTKESLLTAVYGDAYEAACEAVLEVTADFLGSRGAKMLRSRKAVQRIETELENQNLERLELMTGEEAFAMLTKLLGGSIGSGGSVADYSASTPAPTPSAS